MTNVTPAKLRSFYISALCVIALLVSLSEFQFSELLELQKQESTIINKAGEQRMLSQKIALYLTRINFTERNSLEYNQQREIISEAINKFKENHNYLSTLPSLPEAIYKLYFDSPQPIDSRVNRLVTYAESQINAAESATPTRELLLEPALSQPFYEQLLFDLNLVVNLFELQAKQNIADLNTYRNILWVIILIVLVLEAVLIFFPMEKLVFSSLEQEEQSAQKARQSQLEAEQANKAKSEFLASMSHELRTPMNGMFGMMDLALENPQNNKEYLLKAQASGKQLLNLINDILDLSKVEAGELHLEFRTVKINDLFDTVLSNYSTISVSKNLSFNFAKTKQLPPYIKTDPTRLAQILNNIISNAVKFTERGSVDITVDWLETKEERSILKIKVKDTGIGMTEEQVETVFHRFTQADQSTTRKYGGTGLGMSITKELLNLFDGNIEINSEFGVGTEFIVTIPSEVASAPKQITTNRDSNELIKVAIVDDLETSRLRLKALMEQHGLQCDVYGSAQTLLESTSDLNIIITDLAMPQLSGNDLLNALIEKECVPPHVIICSAALEMFDKELETKLSDMTQIYKVQKPIDSLSISQVINEIINNDSHVVKKINDKSILIVEDNQINREIVKAILFKENAKIEIATDGLEAIEQFKQHRFDLILMDMSMPNMDGITATQILRENHNCNIPIIALTANAFEQDREKCIKAGMDDYLTKPIKKEVLIKKIKQYI